MRRPILSLNKQIPERDDPRSAVARALASPSPAGLFGLAKSHDPRSSERKTPCS